MIFVFNGVLLVAISVSLWRAGEANIKFRWHDLFGFSLIGAGFVYLNNFILNSLVGTQDSAGAGHLLFGSLLSNLLFIGHALSKKKDVDA